MTFDRKKYHHDYYMKNREKSLEQGREYRAAQLENNLIEYRKKGAEKTARYRERHREEVNRRNKHYKRKSTYGITIAHYNDLLNKQNNRCAICGKEKRLGVDHDHNTGIIRELLCINCNLGLGCFGDNLDLMTKAISYLRKYK